MNREDTRRALQAEAETIRKRYSEANDVDEKKRLKAKYQQLGYELEELNAPPPVPRSVPSYSRIKARLSDTARILIVLGGTFFVIAGFTFLLALSFTSTSLTGAMLIFTFLVGFFAIGLIIAGSLTTRRFYCATCANPLPTRYLPKCPACHALFCSPNSR